MNQIEKVLMAINYIEDHLMQKLDLDKIAEAVHYSKYHLHRVFSKTVGITIHDYLKRRQLTEAAKLLVFSGQSIMDIALLSGYDSQQAFHNAFKSMYKQSPNQYRDNERFYPLQLRFEFEGSFHMLKETEEVCWEVVFAGEADIPAWMGLVRLVVAGYPFLHEDDYIEELKCRIRKKQALISKDGETAVGVMLFSHQTGSIDFMGTHPLYRKKGVPKVFLDKVMDELLKGKELSITTYREGDKADTGFRREIMELGFAEAELLVELGYPTQRFVMRKEENNG